ASRSPTRSRCRTPTARSTTSSAATSSRPCPTPRALSEIRRALRPAGRAHLIAEDYGMRCCHPTQLNARRFWQEIPWRFEAAVGGDLHVGRKTFTILHDLGFVDIACDYVVVDTLRVDREIFARIWEAWRDGYTDTIVEKVGVPRDEVERRW